MAGPGREAEAREATKSTTAGSAEAGNIRWTMEDMVPGKSSS